MNSSATSSRCDRGQRLGGADVFTLPSAYQLVESLRIDSGHLGPFGIHP